MEQSVANLVDMRDVSFTRGNRCIFDNISLTVPRGKITAIMGPSGIGKTTLLRLIGGQIAPDHGEILFDGENIPAMSRSRLYTVRKRMSMLFQSGALFTDMNVFDNVAYPLREHTQLPAPLLHSTVGWRGVQRWRVRLRWSRISSCLMNLLLGKIPSPWAYW